MGQIILVTGGAKSGKSAFAELMTERIAGERGGRPGYIATAQAFDDEMAERIRRHRERRERGQWRTFEEPLTPARVIAEIARSAACGAILLDCITVLTSNLILERPLNWDAPATTELRALEARVMAEIRALADAAAGFSGSCVMVANEVGFGVVPPSPLGRFFRDCAGAASQYLAARAEAVYLVVAGMPLALKQYGEPVCNPWR